MKILSKSYNFNINVINGKEKFEGNIVIYVINFIIICYLYIYYILFFCCKFLINFD